MSIAGIEDLWSMSDGLVGDAQPRRTWLVQRRFLWAPAGEMRMGNTASCLFQVLLSVLGPQTDV